jgi:hypothetical protein
MKTTVDLPDALANRAREVARQQGVTLRELVAAGLRAELDRRRARPSQRPAFRFRTVGGSGLRAGVTPGALVELGYEQTPT